MNISKLNEELDKLLEEKSDIIDAEVLELVYDLENNGFKDYIGCWAEGHNSYCGINDLEYTLYDLVNIVDDEHDYGDLHLDITSYYIGYDPMTDYEYDLNSEHGNDKFNIGKGNIGFKEDNLDDDIFSIVIYLQTDGLYEFIYKNRDKYKTLWQHIIEDTPEILDIVNKR